MSNTNAPGAAAYTNDFEPVDYRPLTDPDNLEAFRAFRQWAKATKQPWAPTTRGLVLMYIYVSFMFVMLSAVFGSMVGGLAAHFSGSAAFGIFFGFVPAIGFLVYIAVSLILERRKSKIGGYWEQWYRSYHFAAANNLRWQLNSRRPTYPGSAFTLGSDTKAYEHFMTSSGRFRDIGNLSYVTGSGKSSTTHQWGFMALKLDRRIPHCVVDALSNNGILRSNMPNFGKDQILHLEGDFDRYFTLYCPREYERDALYIFTPDLMALLIDNVSAFDVEIVDDWMFVYSTKPWDLQNAWTWYRLFMIAHTVGAKTVARTERYRDDRAMPSTLPGTAPALPATANNRVAPQGERLTKRFSWIPLIVTTIVMVVIIGVPLLPMLFLAT